CISWYSSTAVKICANSVAVGLGYLNPPSAIVAGPNEPTMSEAPAGPQFVAADSADAALTTLHVILPPNFAAAWQKGQIMIVVEAEGSRNRTLVSALPKKNTFAVDDADLVLIERPLLLDGDRALHFLAFDLPRLREAFDVRAGEGVRLPEIATARPVFDLRLAGTLNSVTSELMCTYGDRVPIKALAKAQDQFAFRDPQNVDRVLMRNLDAENAAVARLEQIGFARTDAGGFVLHGQLNVVRFFATDYQRLQRDWKIILTAQVEKWTGEIERATPKLEIVGSGQDWFDVRYSLT